MTVLSPLTEFGNRTLDNDDDVFQHNAWFRLKFFFFKKLLQQPTKSSLGMMSNGMKSSREKQNALLKLSNKH